MNLMNFWKCLPARATLYWPSSVTVVGKCGDRSRSSSKCQDAGKHNGAVRRWAARKILTSQTSRLGQMSENSSSFTMSNHFQPKTLMNFVWQKSDSAGIHAFFSGFLSSRQELAQGLSMRLLASRRRQRSQEPVAERKFFVQVLHCRRDGFFLEMLQNPLSHAVPCCPSVSKMSVTFLPLNKSKQLPKVTHGDGRPAPAILTCRTSSSRFLVFLLFCLLNFHHIDPPSQDSSITHVDGLPKDDFVPHPADLKVSVFWNHTTRKPTHINIANLDLLPQKISHVLMGGRKRFSVESNATKRNKHLEDHST